MSPVMFLEHLVKIVEQLKMKGELHMVAELVQRCINFLSNISIEKFMNIWHN